MREFRRRCQQQDPRDLVFFDQTQIKLEQQPSFGLARKGHTPKAVGKTREQWEPRVDFCGAVGWSGPLCGHAMTPKDRMDAGVKGYTKDIVLDWVNESLAGEIERMKPRQAVVCIDQGLKLTKDEVIEELNGGGADNVRDVWIMPTNGGKLLDPLDNTLWHTWKEKVMSQRPTNPDDLAKVMLEQFDAIPTDDVRRCFRKCSLLSCNPVTRDLN